MNGGHDVDPSRLAHFDIGRHGVQRTTPGGPPNHMNLPDLLSSHYGLGEDPTYEGMSRQSYEDGQGRKRIFQALPELN